MARNERVAIAVVAQVGATICSRSLQSRFVPARKFRAFFGVSVSIAADVWAVLPYRAYGEVKYLLWALMFLKIYETEQIHATLAGCDEKSFRKWSKTYIYLLADISTVRTVARTSAYIY